jgi:hypothetical protein
MGLFGKRRQQELDHAQNEARYDSENAIAVISARLRFLEAFTCDLVAELPIAKRDRLLQQLQDLIGELKVLPPPPHAPPGKELEFRTELGNALHVFIEKTNNAKPKPINRSHREAKHAAFVDP